MFVCLCKAVTDHEIEAAVNDGVTTFHAMQDELGVAQTCGNCACEVANIIEKKLAQTLSHHLHPAREINLSL